MASDAIWQADVVALRDIVVLKRPYSSNTLQSDSAGLGEVFNSDCSTTQFSSSSIDCEPVRRAA